NAPPPRSPVTKTRLRVSDFSEGFRMADNAELTGLELDRAIAKWLGWTHIETVMRWEDVDEVGYYQFEALRGYPMGKDDYSWVSTYHDDLDATAAECAKRGWALLLYPEEVGICIPSLVNLASDEDGTHWELVGTKQ